MSNKLEQLWAESIQKPWHASVKISDAVAYHTTEGREQQVLYCSWVPRPQEPGKSKYYSIDHARLIAVLHNIVPEVLRLMEVSDNSNNLSVRVAMKNLNKAIEAHGTAALLVTAATWREADTKADAAAKEPKKIDGNLSKDERRKLRRQLRKERRARESAT